ncbi:MAG: glycoside hydrolase family 13 protein [Bacteroidota bacterium]
MTVLWVASKAQGGGEEVSQPGLPATPYTHPPAWAQEVIWYEIGVERFRNGDPSNDPTAEDIQGAYPGFVPDNWAITPWTQDWYQEDSYMLNLEAHRDTYGNPLTKFVDKVQMRRYGGDLQGVLDKMDYLDSLGVTAVYFRPLNDGPSLHKYDVRNWRHIDRNFGPDPQKDKETIASEIPHDPGTWKFTEADNLFLELIEAFHQRGIKVILDYSWNHTGNTFWAWQDVLAHQEKSEFKDWYWIDRFDHPETPEDEFTYHGWVGVSELPEIKETQKQDLSKGLSLFEGNIFSEAVKEHIFHVVHRWLDPNQDGDCSDGVDGYRLDVAAETPQGFWREFREHVRGINPDAYLLGEIWWEEWPDKLLNPEPYLRGDVFDAVMNYRWYRAARHLLNAAPSPIPVSEFIDSLTTFKSHLRPESCYAMMNLNGGFDTPRVLTSLFNKNKYKYYCKAHEDPNYKIHKPDPQTFQTLKLLLAHQYTYIGAPHIYAGDEMGMWGADDPSCRKPLIWPDLTFQSEKQHPLGKERPVDEVVFNRELFRYYQKLINIRKESSVLRQGDIEFMQIEQDPEILAYRRFMEDKELYVFLNVGYSVKRVQIAVDREASYSDKLSNGKVSCDSGMLTIELPARTASIVGS